MIHTIWQNTGINIEDWTDFLEEEYPDVTDEYEQYRLVEEMNEMYILWMQVNL